MNRAYSLQLLSAALACCLAVAIPVNAAGETNSTRAGTPKMVIPEMKPNDMPASSFPVMAPHPGSGIGGMPRSSPAGRGPASMGGASLPQGGGARAPSAGNAPQAPGILRAPRVRVNYWSCMTAMAGSAIAYGAYTYVLSGKIATTPKEAEALHKLEGLIARLCRTVLNIEHADKMVFHPDEMNIFIIPANQVTNRLANQVTSRFDFRNYNFPLSRGIVDRLAVYINDAKAVDVLKHNTGPFLVTLDTPISQLENIKVMLFVDLTHIEESTYDRLLAQYMEAVQVCTTPPCELKNWKLIRLLSMISEIANSFMTVSEWISPKKTEAAVPQ